MRERSPLHLRYVRSMNCMVCRAAPPSDPHHVKFAEPRGMSMKVSDRYCVPLCRICHDQVELAGDEEKWWSERGLRPLAVAADLWMGEIPF